MPQVEPRYSKFYFNLRSFPQQKLTEVYCGKKINNYNGILVSVKTEISVEFLYYDFHDIDFHKVYLRGGQKMSSGAELGARPGRELAAELARRW